MTGAQAPRSINPGGTPAHGASSTPATVVPAVPADAVRDGPVGGARTVTDAAGRPVATRPSPGLAGNGLVAPLLDGLSLMLGGAVGAARAALMGPSSPHPAPWVSADPAAPGRFAG